MRLRLLLDDASSLDTGLWRELALAARSFDDVTALVPVSSPDERDDWQAAAAGIPLRLLVDGRFATPDSGLLARAVEVLLADAAAALLVAPEGGVAAEAAARLAVARSAILLGGVTSWWFAEPGVLEIERQGPAERNVERLRVDLAEPAVLTAKAWFGARRVGAARPGGERAVETWAVPAELERDTEVGVQREVALADLDISDAPVVVAAGLGFADESRLALLEALAGALGGVVGATRPLVDKGWLPFERQIGTTGRTVTPDLYVAVGISGAFHHVGGVRARHVIAVNTDRAAPMMGLADLAVVADLEEYLPALTDALAGVVR